MGTSTYPSSRVRRDDTPEVASSAVTNTPSPLVAFTSSRHWELDPRATRFAMVSGEALGPGGQNEQGLPSEPGPYQLGVNPGTNRALVSSLCNGRNHTAGGKILVTGE